MYLNIPFCYILYLFLDLVTLIKELCTLYSVLCTTSTAIATIIITNIANITYTSQRYCRYQVIYVNKQCFKLNSNTIIAATTNFIFTTTVLICNMCDHLLLRALFLLKKHFVLSKVGLAAVAGRNCRHHDPICKPSHNNDEEVNIFIPGFRVYWVSLVTTTGHSPQNLILSDGIMSGATHVTDVTTKLVPVSYREPANYHMTLFLIFQHHHHESELMCVCH